MNYLPRTENHDCPVTHQYALLRHVVDHNDQTGANHLFISTLAQCRQIREKIEGQKKDQLANMTWLLFLIAAVTTIMAIALQQALI